MEPQPPLAEAGPDQEVGEGVKVRLDGSNSTDLDGSVAAYFWEQIEGNTVSLSDPTAVEPTFFSGTTGEALVFQLTVTDNTGLKAKDIVIVNVISNNFAPIADAGDDQTVNEGDTVALDGSGSTDSDGMIISYHWEQIVGTPVSLSDPKAVDPNFISPTINSNGEALAFRLTITDDDGLKATDITIVNIVINNMPPIADAGSDQTVDEGETVVLDGSRSTDPDGIIIAYLWTQRAGISVTLSDPKSVNPTFVTSPVDPDGAILGFELMVKDDDELLASEEVTIAIVDNTLEGFPDDVLPFISATGEYVGIQMLSEGNLTQLKVIDPDTIPDFLKKPKDLTYGLFALQIKTKPGATEKIVFYVANPFMNKSGWIKYSASQGWIDFSADASYNESGDRVVLTITDGGKGDDDGVANGVIIIDPSGPGTMSAYHRHDSDICFIDTAAYGLH
jgi:hypothetical protein